MRDVESDELKDLINHAVQNAFSAGIGDGRYIDVSRIPLICQSITSIDKKLDDLVSRQEFWPVKMLVYGITGLMLSAVVGALMMLVITKH